VSPILSQESYFFFSLQNFELKMILKFPERKRLSEGVARRGDSVLSRDFLA